MPANGSVCSAINDLLSKTPDLSYFELVRFDLELWVNSQVGARTCWWQSETDVDGEKADYSRPSRANAQSTG